MFVFDAYLYLQQLLVLKHLPNSEVAKHSLFSFASFPRSFVRVLGLLDISTKDSQYEYVCAGSPAVWNANYITTDWAGKVEIESGCQSGYLLQQPPSGQMEWIPTTIDYKLPMANGLRCEVKCIHSIHWECSWTLLLTATQQDERAQSNGFDEPSTIGLYSGTVTETNYEHERCWWFQRVQKWA